MTTTASDDGCRSAATRGRVLVIASLVLLTTACSAAKSRDAISSSCKLDEVKYCLEAASMYEKGEGGRKSLSVALWYYEEACRKGAPAGCQRAGEMWESGDVGEKDVEKAQEYYDKAKALSG